MPKKHGAPPAHEHEEKERHGEKTQKEGHEHKKEEHKKH
jgi:hypothetical protein